MKTAIERTAYPRFAKTKKITNKDLVEFYTPTSDELYYAERYTKDDSGLLRFLVALKSFQRLGYFSKNEDIPKEIIGHIYKSIDMNGDICISYSSNKAMYAHQKLIRSYMNVRVLDKEGKRLLALSAENAAKTMNTPADIINYVIDCLILHRYELPAFSSLDREIRKCRNNINQQFYKDILEKIPEEMIRSFDQMLLSYDNSYKTTYNSLKTIPKKVTTNNFYDFAAHLNWLDSFGNTFDLLKDFPKTKISEFAREAKMLDASDLKNLKPARRYCLMLCLLNLFQTKSKDNLAKMFCKLSRIWHKKAQFKLDELKLYSLNKAEKIAGLMSGIIQHIEDKNVSRKLSDYIQDELNSHGGNESIKKICDEIVAYSKKQYLFLVNQFISSRQKPICYRVLDMLKIQSSNQDKKMIRAINFIKKNKDNKNELLNNSIDISFASKEWQDLVSIDKDGKQFLIKRHLEACIFSSIANELNSGDLFIVGANAYSDYRLHLLNWNLCQEQLHEYCNELNIPNNPKAFVKGLKQELSKKIKDFDLNFPNIKGLSIKNEKPILKDRKLSKTKSKKTWLQKDIDKRMPERNILDILCSTHHYTGWANNFGPISGAEPRSKNSLRNYIVTSFCYGSSMGPTQASKHFRGHEITPHVLSWTNRRHITLNNLDKSIGNLINASNKFQLTNIWGDGKSCAADGTLCSIYEDNLLSEHHVRYGKRGGIAYYHIANNYIALFSTFIPCGVWEAVAIIDGILKTKSDIVPETIHSDTQGQSATVFGLSYLLGIKLMPRIRNWKSYTFYKPSNNIKYKNVELLFATKGKSKAINWKIIEEHWNDFMQVILSIKAGAISTTFLLQRLTNYARKNKLFKVMNELGKVIRTMFLIDYVSNLDLRREITASTNKVESYNSFSNWLRFGEEYYMVASNDPDEQEKAVKYNCLLANSIILQNIVDITNIVKEMLSEGIEVTTKDVSQLSPYITHHIKRFGDYALNIKEAKFINSKQNTEILNVS